MNTPMTFREAEAHMATALDGYESREPQQAFASAVERALAEGNHLMAEAGCGTGKSFGYLVPSLLWAKATGKRVVVSTATKALQDQIADFDLPFLLDTLPLDGVTGVVLKGRSNYLCMNRARSADRIGPSEMATLETWFAANAEDPDATGYRSDLPPMDDPVWWDISSESDDCSSLDCNKDPEMGCFAARARSRAVAANVIIVNHALLFTELNVREASGGAASLLGEFDRVVFDEGHEIEEWATSMLGASLKAGSVEWLLGQVRAFLSREGWNGDDINSMLDPILAANVELWTSLDEFHREDARYARDFDDDRGNGRLRGDDLLARENLIVPLVGGLRAVRDRLENINPTQAKGGAKRRRLVGRIDSMSARYVEAWTAPTDAVVRWVEMENRRNREVLHLKTAPIEVGEFLRRALFATVPTIIVSATLSTDGNFDYVAGRLGLDTYDELLVGTPFDFARQAATYVPRDLPLPRGRSRRDWEAQSVREMLRLVEAAEGGALLLFTSKKSLNEAFRFVSARTSHECRVQGGGDSNQELVAWLKGGNDRVLFATKSFFTGVDFKGDSVRLVVIDKMPFPVPSDPIIQARCEAIKANGGNDFADFTVPFMTLVLQQGYGRLIRSTTDTGVVAILDGSLTRKSYGKRILRSLPEAPLVESFDGLNGHLSGAAVPA